MNPYLALFILVGYFGLLIVIGRITARKSDSYTFFNANRQSPWYLVAFGMIGASLSGVTFISVPGQVSNSQFAYMQVVMGYMVGYAIIAWVLIPLYYRLNMISIYQFLQQKFGNRTYKTGAVLFIVSRLFGSSARLFLAAYVLHMAIFEQIGIPFWLTVSSTILLVMVYSGKGGIKTIVYTDVFQTVFMLLAAFLSLLFISQKLDLSLGQISKQIFSSKISNIFVWNWQSPQFFPKQFIGGALIALTMTGLDQDMMQKNLTCKNVKQAKLNVFGLSASLIVVNYLFLMLGAAIYFYSLQLPLTTTATDQLFPIIAFNYLPKVAGAVFFVGVIAAAYSSADSSLTALTTSFSFDLLDLGNRPESQWKKVRQRVHYAFAFATILVTIAFGWLNNSAVIETVLKAATYTYGPLLGLFVFGLWPLRKPNDKLTPLIALVSVIVSAIADIYSVQILNGYKFGFELLLVNAIITYVGIYITGKKSSAL